MSDNLHYPKRDDAVIGGQNPPPIHSIVLGGLEGVKRRMTNASVELRSAAVKEALKYGQDGLELVIQALHDPSHKLQWDAYLLLRTREEPIVKEALQGYIPSIYRNLHDLLADGKWQDADQETATVMLKIASREKAGWLRVEDISQFPSLDLGMIDQFWLQSSNGRFGFSVQKQIWQKVSNNYFAFGDRIGWRRGGSWLNYPRLTFSATAPAGHLPAAHLTWDSLKQGQTWLWYGGTEEDVRWFEIKSLLSRRDLSSFSDS